MSLARDFHNYYGECYIGYRNRAGGPIVPFYVSNIRTGRNRNEDDYSQGAVDALRFSGYTINQDGQTNNIENLTLESNKIILEIPELGYAKIGNTWYWLSYKPQRSTKKGICGRRLDGLRGRRMDDATAQAIYVASENEPLRNHFLVDEGKLMYKGRQVGLCQREGHFDLYIPYRYLSHFIRKAFGDAVAVELVEEEQNA